MNKASTVILSGIVAASASLAALAKGEFDAHHNQPTFAAGFYNAVAGAASPVVGTLEALDFERHHSQEDGTPLQAPDL